VRTVFFAVQDDGFRITIYVSHRFTVQRESAGRDLRWERIAENSDMAGVYCIYFGGDENVL
jgi:hypothetical protein